MTQREQERWKSAWRIAEELSEQEPHEREQELAALGERDAELAEAVRVLLTSEEEAQQPSVEVTFGQYLLQKPLGSGGSGEVWQALDTALGRRVAVKILRTALHDEAADRRFEYEASLQAQLKHPNIASVLETGTSPSAGGRHVRWIAMDLVEGGRTIVEHVRDADLSAREVAALFAKLASAIGLGHELGILHRDIKPSNVLVTHEGEPVVIDFGIARGTLEDESRTAPETLTGTVLGTPPYMAPERLDPQYGQTGARADVYSLGLVLFELLTGSPRLEPGSYPIDVTGLVRERMEPGPAPSSIAAAVPRELDWIVSKATAFDPDRRYPNGSGLADDIERYLSHEAPIATPPSSSYRLKLLLRRNRTLAVAGAIVLVAILTGAITAAWGLVREARASESARLANDESELALSMLEEVFHELEPGAGLGAAPERMVEFSETVSAAYEEALSSGHRTQPRVHGILADLFGALGNGREAVRLRREALDSIIEDHGPDSLASDRGRHLLAKSLTTIGEFDEADTLLGDLLNRIARDSPLIDERSAILHSDLGLCLLGKGETSRAATHLSTALAWMKDRLAPTDEELLRARHRYSNVLTTLGRFSEASDELESVFEQRKNVRGSGDPVVLATAVDWATTLRKLGEHDRATDVFDSTIEQASATLPDDHPDLLAALSQYAGLCSDLGRYSEAAELQQRILVAQSRIHDADNPLVQTTQHNLAEVLNRAGRPDDALAIVEELVPVRRRTLGRHAYLTLISVSLHGSILVKLGRYADAEPVLWDAYVALCDSADTGPEHPQTITSLVNHATALQGVRRFSQAEEELQEALGLLEDTAGPTAGMTLQVRVVLANLRFSMGNAREAEAAIRPVVDAFAEAKQGATPSGLFALNLLGRCLLAQGRPRDAIAALAGSAPSSQAPAEMMPPEGLALRLTYGRALFEVGDRKGGEREARFVAEAAAEDSSTASEARSLLHLIESPEQ